MEYQKTEEATDDLISNKIASKIRNVSRSSPQNNSERITNEHDKERCISPEERQKILDNLTLI